jgi:GT2 family glycosyltransferase|uniref:Glycosyl transferase family 2 n=2 Tax=Ralstonia pickettii TaxID=329 RepID=C6BLW3_RALP1
MQTLDDARTAQPPCSIVVLTHNRAATVLDTLGQLTALGEPWPIIVVDNGSTDGTADQIAARFPDVTLVRAPRNYGAAGRNVGAASANTPYVAFCDDDTAWLPGSIGRAVTVLQRYPAVGVVAAHIVVGPTRRDDPACEPMAASTLPADGLPGPALLGFMAGACVVRARAFSEAGGYQRDLFIGGEESVLALDLVDAGWHIVYCREVVTHHNPSPVRDVMQRRALLARNELLSAWLRLPSDLAWRVTGRALRAMVEQGVLAEALPGALVRLPRTLLRRHTVQPCTVALWRQMDADRQRRRAIPTLSIG